MFMFYFVPLLTFLFYFYLSLGPDDFFLLNDSSVIWALTIDSLIENYRASIWQFREMLGALNNIAGALSN